MRKNGRTHADHLVLGQNQDDLFAIRLVEELEFRHGIDVSTLDVGVRNGVATVRGVVSDPDELEAVEDTIREGGGISEMECLVQIAPSRREEDRDRARQIQEALDAEPDLASQNIQVSCLSRKVVLRGTVASVLAKAKAGLMALRQDEVARVRNRIVVIGAPDR